VSSSQIVRPASFDVSNFKRHYLALKSVEHQHQLFAAVHALILGYCRMHGLDPARGEDFFRRLQREAFKKVDELLSEMDAASQRMWTSKLELLDCGRAHKKELSAIINAAIRSDVAVLVAPAAQLARNINELVVTNTREAPAIPPACVSFRGSCMPASALAFFAAVPGRKIASWRVPAAALPLATASTVTVALSTGAKRMLTVLPNSALSWRSMRRASSMA
jgi:hypothetical protein